MCMYPELVIAPQAIQQMTKAHCQTVVDYEFERTFFTGVAWLVSRKRLKRHVQFVKNI